MATLAYTLSDSDDTEEDETTKAPPPRSTESLLDELLAMLPSFGRPRVAACRRALNDAGGDVSCAHAMLLQLQQDKRQRTTQQPVEDASYARALQHADDEARAAAAVTARHAEAASEELARVLQQAEYAAAAVGDSGTTACNSGGSSSRCRTLCKWGHNYRDRVQCAYFHPPRDLPTRLVDDRLTEAQVIIVTWNCEHAAPATGENQHKLRRTLDKLRKLLGRLPDAIALQETLLANQARLHVAQGATPEYAWSCPHGKAQRLHMLRECDSKADPGRGSWLLVLKGGQLDGGRAIDTSSWDDQDRVVALDTRHGVVVAAYMPACCNQAAINRQDGPRYHMHMSHFLRQHRERLLAVVGDLNMTFDACDRTDRHKQPMTTGDFRAVRAMLDGAGLVDAWRHHHPHTLEWSREDNDFSSHQPSGSWARVDHVLVPAKLVATSTVSRVCDPACHQAARAGGRASRGASGGALQVSPLPPRRLPHCQGEHTHLEPSSNQTAWSSEHHPRDS
jgi:exonuclease III